MWSALFAFTFFDCRRSKPRRHSSQSLTHPALKQNYKIIFRLSDTAKSGAIKVGGKVEPARAKGSGNGHPIAELRSPSRVNVFLTRVKTLSVKRQLGCHSAVRKRKRGVVCERIKIFRNSGLSVALFAKSARHRCGSPSSNLTSRTTINVLLNARCART